MKKLKEKFTIALIILFICGGGFIRYKIWKAEHPQAKTWMFFVSKSK